MHENLVKECLSLKARIISLCDDIGAYDSTCKNMMQTVLQNIDSPANSEAKLNELNENELLELIENFKVVLLKMEKVMADINKTVEKSNPPSVDEKIRKKELMIQAIFNRLYYFRYRIFKLFGIEIK